MQPSSAPAFTAVHRVDPIRRVLALGIATPVIYFGIQFMAAPFFPDYSFFSHDASSLGSSDSTAPWIFNVGSLVVGVLSVAVAGAFLFALPRAGVGRVLATLSAMALVSAGIGSFNAFLHPLPDPRHTDGLLANMGGGAALLPVLMSAVLWRLGARRLAVVTTIVWLALIPIVSGLIQRACIWSGTNCDVYQSFLNSSHGILQRVAAAVAFVPIAVIAHLLRRRSSGAMFEQP
jgi:hypothetical protein